MLKKDVLNGYNVQPVNTELILPAGINTDVHDNPFKGTFNASDGTLDTEQTALIQALNRVGKCETVTRSQFQQLLLDTTTIGRTLYNGGFMGKKMLKVPQLIKTFWKHYNTKKPTDAEIYRPKQSDAEADLLWFLSNYIKENSKVHGHENLQAAMELNADPNTRVVFMGMPHKAGIDPLILKILLQRLAAENNGLTGEAATEFDQKMIVPISHKVTQARLSLMFIGALDTVLTIQSKYKLQLEGDELTMANAFIEQVSTLLKQLRSSPDWALYLYPEGGFSGVNGRIALEREAIAMALRAYVVPVYMKVPDWFFRPGANMNTTPATIDAYIGKPELFKPTKLTLPDGARAKNGVRAEHQMSELWQLILRSLSTVEAPINEDVIGYMIRGVQDQFKEYNAKTHTFTSA